MVRLKKQPPLLLHLSPTFSLLELDHLAATFLTSPPTKAKLITTPHFSFNRPGNYLLFTINTSLELEVKISTSKVKVLVLAAYLGQNKDNYFFNLKESFSAPFSQSLVRVVSVLDNQARFKYRVTTQAAATAHSISAYQENYNLLLSSQAEVDSQPFLEISNGQLNCSHSSVTTPLDEEKTNFLQSRGLNFNQTKELLIQEIFQTLEDKFRNFFAVE